ncbi:g12517 [Coccomyxa viridis]|uniref:G12517 protein n=1 Tax=Coccomyxa viridis TaxID=1274662 RepID=A0ABP1GD77_9CHLO
MSLSTKHAQHKKMPLDSTKLLWGARTCLRGAARRYVSSAATAQQQGASPVRAGLTMVTRHAAAQKSSIARVQATAQKRRAQPQALLAPAMTVGQAPQQTRKPRSRAQKSCSRKLRVGHSSKPTQPDRLRAARAAQQAQSMSQRASTLAQRRSPVSRLSQAAETPLPAFCFQVTGTSPDAQKSRGARARAPTPKKHAHAEEIPAAASDSQPAPQSAEKRLSRRLSEPAMLRVAARKAELARGRAQRADILSQKRGQDGSASATCSQSDEHAQQQPPMQAESRSTPTMGDQPMRASMAAGDQHMPAAQARAEDSSDMEQCSNQGRHSRGSPGTPEQAQEDLGSPHIVDRPPAMQPHHPFMAEPAAGIPQSSLAGEEQPQRQGGAPTQEPGRTGVSPAIPAKHSRSSGCCSMHSTMSSGGPSKRSIEVSAPAAAEQPPRSRGKSESLLAGEPYLSSKENLHPNILKGLTQAKAVRPAPRLGRSSQAPSPLSGVSLPCTDRVATAQEHPAGPERLPSSREALKPLQAHSLSSRDDGHSQPPKAASQAAAEERGPRLRRHAGPAAAPPASAISLCANDSASADAPSARREQQPPSHGATRPAMPAQASEESFHPRRLKTMPRQKPDWREASLEDGHSWLLYTKVLHRRHGGGSADYQTLTLQLPEEKCKQTCPRYGRQTFLQVETKPEDDPNIPFMARLARHQRDRVIKCNGGIAPEEGHKDYKNGLA